MVLARMRTVGWHRVGYGPFKYSVLGKKQILRYRFASKLAKAIQQNVFSAFENQSYLSLIVLLVEEQGIGHILQGLLDLRGVV